MKLSVKRGGFTSVCIVGDVHNVLVAIDVSDGTITSVDIFCILKEGSLAFCGDFLGCLMFA